MTSRFLVATAMLAGACLGCSEESSEQVWAFYLGALVTDTDSQSLSHNLTDAREPSDASDWNSSGEEAESEAIVFAEIVALGNGETLLVLQNRTYLGSTSGTTTTYAWDRYDKGDTYDSHEEGYAYLHDWNDHLTNILTLMEGESTDTLTGEWTVTNTTDDTFHEDDTWNTALVDQSFSQMPLSSYLVVEDQFGNKTTGFAGDLTIATTPESTAPATVAPTLTLQAADDDAGQTIYMGEEHTDPPFPHDHTYEAHIQGANDGETIRYWRLMWYDPTAAAGERWKVCKEVGPMIRYGFNAAIDIDDEECIATGTNIYYVEIEQALAIDEKFMVHLENKYIDFVVDGDATEYSAALYHWPGVKWYTAADLATEIADAMNTAYTPGCDPFSASYDTGTHEFTITNDEEDVFDLLWLSGDHGFWEDLDPNVGGSQDNAARLLGFNAIDDEDLSSYTSDFAIHSDGWSEREMA